MYSYIQNRCSFLFYFSKSSTSIDVFFSFKKKKLQLMMSPQRNPIRHFYSLLESSQNLEERERDPQDFRDWRRSGRRRRRERREKKREERRRRKSENRNHLALNTLSSIRKKTNLSKRKEKVSGLSASRN